MKTPWRTNERTTMYRNGLLHLNAHNFLNFWKSHPDLMHPRYASAYKVKQIVRYHENFISDILPQSNNYFRDYLLSHGAVEYLPLLDSIELNNISLVTHPDSMFALDKSKVPFSVDALHRKEKQKWMRQQKQEAERAKDESRWNQLFGSC